jgi:hypothetical protein
MEGEGALSKERVGEGFESLLEIFKYDQSPRGLVQCGVPD